MGVLRSRLYALAQRRQRDKMAELQGEKKDIAWGNQIRSYVLAPYQLVKDHRTGLRDGQRGGGVRRSVGPIHAGLSLVATGSRIALMYEFFVSLRYLKSRRRQGFISLITLISVGGVAVGVMVLIVVLSVMSGFETTLKEKLLGINAHLWVLPQRTGQLQGYRDLVSRIETIPRVTHATPFTAHEVMLMAGRRVAGTIVRGIDPDERSQTGDFARLFEGRDLTALLNPPGGADNGVPQSARRGIVLGTELARTLRVAAGEQIILNSPLGILQPAGILPNMRGFTVTGTFETGMYEYDAKLALISLDEAQELFDLGEVVHGIEVRVDDIYRVRDVSEATEALLGSGCLDARLDADEPNAFFGTSAGAGADVHHSSADYPGWPPSTSSAP